ncbi:GNAT family N-acetyltransferase [Candidatus Saccharibacteria bacterium]|nr:GNAT family N-acetyltransferase [Candidatus Saccharibacteria bacterium]
MTNAKVIQDAPRAIEVIKNSAQWLVDSGKENSKWWDPAKLSLNFFCPYAKADEFYVLLVDNQPAAAVILQAKQNMQDWSAVDGSSKPKALYIHYVAVHRDFAGQNLVKHLMDFATKLAKKQALQALRLDTNANEPKLCDLYEGLGFKRVKVLKEEGGATVLYEKRLKQ